MPGWVRALQVIFVVAVAFIAAVVLYGPKPALNARYFPQPLTSFTLDALGVFYLSLSLSVLFMIGQRGMATLVTYLGGHRPGHHHCDRDIAEHRHLPFHRAPAPYRVPRHLPRGDDRHRGNPLVEPPRNEPCRQASRLTGSRRRWSAAQGGAGCLRCSRPGRRPFPAAEPYAHRSRRTHAPHCGRCARQVVRP